MHSSVGFYGGIPTEGFCLRVFRLPVIDDDDVMVFLQVGLQCRFGGSGYATPEAGFFTGPTESITLAVIFGKH